LIFIVKSPWLGSSSSNSDGLHHAKALPRIRHRAPASLRALTVASVHSTTTTGQVLTVDRCPAPRASHPNPLAPAHTQRMTQVTTQAGDRHETEDHHQKTRE
jgi:hypothetical protein